MRMGTAMLHRPWLRPRAVAIQAAVALGLLAVLWWLWGNLQANLAIRNLRLGFSFLDQPAGFALSEGVLGYQAGDSYLHAFAAGIANTIRVSVAAILLTTLLGTLIGIGRLVENRVVRALASGYVDIVRNVPLLVQVLVWYIVLNQALPPGSDALNPLPDVYLSKEGLSFPAPLAGLGWTIAGWGTLAALVTGWLVGKASGRCTAGGGVALLGIVAAFAAGPLLLGAPLAVEVPEANLFTIAGGGTLSPEFLALLTALTLYHAAYMAEIVRAGIAAVPKGQWEAAAAVGLGRGRLLTLVVLPQALRVIIPPYISLSLNITKNSSLAVAIGYPDVVAVANTSMNQNGQAVECILIVAAVYLTMSLLTSAVLNLYNRKFALQER